MATFFRKLQRGIDLFAMRYDGAVAWARSQSAAFDHIWRTKERYSEVLGGRLAAAIAYYGFFATFALTMIVYSLLVKVFTGSEVLVAEVDEFLGRYFTTLNTDSLKAAAGSIGIVGTVTLVFAGIGWVDSWRSSQRALWRLDQHPGNIFALRIVDLGMLMVFGLLMGISLTAIDLLLQLFEWLSINVTGEWSQTVYATLLSTIINVVIGIALVTILPRMHLSAARLIPTAIAIGIGLTLLNSVGREVIKRTEHNPAYVVVASAVGLLVYLYLFNQIVIWAVAYAATSSRGRAWDLAWGKPRPHTHEVTEPENIGAQRPHGDGPEPDSPSEPAKSAP